MYSMKETCQKVGMSYETLKFYCNQGLVPNVKRNENNYRVFDDRDIAWIESLVYLKRCGMNIHEMKEYLALCQKGPESIPQRKEILEKKRAGLEESIAALNASIDYIDWKRAFYDDVLAGKTAYVSNVAPVNCESEPNAHRRDQGN